MTHRCPLRRLACLAASALALTIAGCGGGSDPAAGPPAAKPTYTVAVTVNTAAAGETFSFSLAGQALSVTQAALTGTFATALEQGTAYTVNQTAGPRTCTLSANRSGTIAANVAVTANCGTPPGASAVKGKFFAPVGTQVVLQNNGGDDLALTLANSPGVTDPYDANSFGFATALPDGSAYQVSLKTTPANQTCSVFAHASGTLPVAVDTVHVGCEFTYDHVSRSSDGSVRGTYFDSSAPVIGGADGPIGSTTQGYGEGRFVAFVSSAAGIAGSSGAHRQIFWRDRLTGQTQLVSANAAGTEGNADSFAPAISADGLTVAFESTASNLAAADSNGVSDVFVWSAVSTTNGAQRVSVGAGGMQANAGSFEPTISGDGTVVAFSSGASNLTAGVSGINTINVYRRSLTTGTNTLVSANAAGTGVGGSRPALSEDGNRLAFYSFAADLVAGDGNGLWDIFVYQHGTAAIARVSLASGGGERNQGSESASRVVAPAISGNGRYVAFATTATNMVAGDTNGSQDVFVVDTQTGAVVRASVTAGGSQGNADSPAGQGERPALSYDGAWVAFGTSAGNLGPGAGNVVIHNHLTGETRTVSNQTGSSTGAPQMSRGAAYVVFGAGSALDSRFTSTGLFVRFTGIANAWWWLP